MTLNTDLSYNFQGEKGAGMFTVKSEPGGKLSGHVQPTGRYVGEPNAHWQIDCFNSHRLGQLVFPETGYYNITVEIAPGKGEEIGFQWLWLGAE